MKHIESYKIFEATSHWKDDLITKLKWDRIDEVYDFIEPFIDIGCELPKRKIAHRGPGQPFVGWLEGIFIDIFDSAFNSPGKKIDVLEREFYQGYTFTIKLQVQNLELFKEVVELLTKLEGYGYQYKLGTFDMHALSIKLYHTEDIIDPRLVISDMKKAKLSNKTGLDYAEELLSRHISIMNISREEDVLVVTQKVDKYGLQSIYEIVSKMLGQKFNIIDAPNGVIVKTRGKWI